MLKVVTGADLIRTTAFSLTLLAACASAQEPAKPAPKPGPDTLIFVSGEQLAGALEKADGKGITFKSPMAGEITVEWKNIRELRSDKNFAILTAGQKLSRKDALAVVPQGKVSVQNKELIVATATGPVTISTDKADRLVDAAAFDKAVNHPPSLLQGWGGTATAGASLVRATQNSTTFNGAINLVRAIPQVDWLPARSRTTLDYNQSYGTVDQPQTPDVAASSIETNVFHADAERDDYFSPRAYGFGSATFDHNYSSLLDLQQAYGGGVGITLLKNDHRTLDFKGDIHYEKETFLPAVGSTVPSSPALNLIGSTFSEKYLVYLPKGLVLNEFGSVSPSWNVPEAYSAHINVNLGFPVFKGFGFNLGYVDDYLNNAPAGSLQNTTQFTTGLTYTIKPR